MNEHEENCEGLPDGAGPMASRQDLLQMLIDHVPGWLALTDADGRYLIVNQKYFETFGGSTGPFIGRRFHEVLPNFVDKHGPLIEACRAGETVSFQERVDFGTGQPTFIQGVYRPIRDTSGATRFMTMIAVDISDRVRAEFARERSEASFDVALHSITDGIVVLDRDDVVLRLNAAAEEMSGWLESDARRHPFHEVFPIIDRNRPTEAVRLAGLTGCDVLCTAAGLLLPVEVRRRPLDLDGSPGKGAILVIRELSEQIKRENERIGTQRTEALALLAGGIGHDFNNMLLAILGHVAMATEHRDLPDEVRRNLEHARLAAERARGLTRQLVTFAKGSEPQRTAVALGSLLREVVHLVVSGSRVACDFNIDPALWPVEADEGQIGQVIQNLILNAIEAMPDGGLLTVSAVNRTLPGGGASSRAEEPCVVFSVSDRGEGIPEALLGRVFEPYVSTKNRRSGLGLAVSHSIVKRHGGSIALQSVVGEGSRFDVTLPARPDLRVEDSAPQSALLSRRLRVLVMDDEASLSEFLEQALEFMGHEVSTTAHGQAALDAYRESLSRSSPYDLVILDLTVPGGLGARETVRLLHRLDPGARAIVTSGYCDDPVMENPREYGFESVLGKPFSLAQLKRAISEATS
jgi:PAS domain S-box-containing protein